MAHDPYTESLEWELQSTRESLQTTIEESETSNEELRSTNEELQSVNEELQSSNEELKTSKEELQSTNEELTTVNTELQHKVNELSQVNNDINNLLASTEIGTIFQSGDYAHIDLKDYLDELIPTMFHNLQISTVGLRLDTERVLVSPDAAIACGLLLNELLTNALKYAFPQNRAGQPDVPPEIQVTLQRVDVKSIELRFSDNGVGLPKDFDLERLKSLGLTLVTGFIQQLQGTFEVNSDHGTHWYIRFPQRS